VSGWFSKGSTPTVVEIARLREQPHEGGVGGVVMLVLGAFAMLVLTFAETSAVRLAAWGTIWTGWNVLWGFAMLMTRRSRYIVVRDVRDGEVVD
jgi:hypothetical protein